MDYSAESGLPFLTRSTMNSAKFGSSFTRRKSKSCYRIWSSFSRLQRSIFSTFALIFACFLILILSKLRNQNVTVKIDHLKAKLERYEKNVTLHFPVFNQIQPPLRALVLTPANNYTPAMGPAPNYGNVQILGPGGVRFTGPQNERQRAVRDAMRHAWNSYKKHAWGHDHLKPISRSYHDWFNLGLTITDNLDTLLIMGMKEEFEDARKWIADGLTFENNQFVNLFEVTIRVLGGLLSAFHLTGDELFKNKAQDLGDRLSGAFNANSKVPFSDVNLGTRKGKGTQWGPDSSLSEISTIQLEFRDLARVTGKKEYEWLAFNVSYHIHKIGCKNHGGLCDMFLNPKTGMFRTPTTITLGARADSYYEYLLKQWLQTGKTIDWLKDDYSEAMSSVITKLLRYSEPNKLTFIGELVGGKTYSPKMDHLVCFLSGTLALGSVNGLSVEHMDVAKQLAHTCNQMYRNPTGLGPEIAHFNMIPTDKKEDLYIKPLDAHSLLRPEAIEGWFYLYRLSGDKIYQEWGWKAFQAIEKYARFPDGYSSIANVKKLAPTAKDMMESFFMAETLKYLYLLLADDQTILPLNEFVFNTEGHPLPVYKC